MRLARPPTGATRLLAGAGLAVLSGCWVTEQYVIPPEQLAQAAQVPAGEAAATALPVHRYAAPGPGGAATGKAVFVRADAIQQALPEPAAAPSVFRSRRYSPVVTAGVVLMTFGSVVSIVESIVYFSTFNSGTDLNLISGVVALSAEPFMLAGTLMWIMGIQKPPQEVPAGRAGVRYLEAAPALTTPALAPAPPPALSLRF